MAERRFIPISEVIALPKERLTREQKRLVDAHEEAKERWSAFLATGKPRVQGIAVVLAHWPETSKEEMAACSAALKALQTAMHYYARNGQWEEAYDDLRGHAETHWHAVVHEQWPHHFSRAADRLGLALLGPMAERVEEDRRAMLRDLAQSTSLALSTARKKKGELH